MEFKKFSSKQKLAMSWWSRKPYCDCDAIICDGAVRSGKTLSMSIGFVSWAMTCFQGGDFAMCGKTVTSLKRNVMSPLLRLLGSLGFTCLEHVSRNYVDITLGGRTNRFYLFGGRDESSAALIQGITLCGVFLDEVVLMPRSFVEQALARCSVTGSRLWFNCNPDHPGHWFYREWIRKTQEKHALYVHFTMADNPALAPSVRARYEATYTGVFYDRYVRGLWVAAEGLIYDMFRPEVHLLRQAADCVGGCYISCDYGTRNPTVFLLWRKLRGAERWVCQKEYYWDGRREMRQKTDGEYADDLLALLDGEAPRGVVVDPSAASFITELRQRGLPVLPGDNRVADGIRAVGELLRGERLLFQAECVHTAVEFRSYVWDEKNAAQGVDKPVKEHDHCMDAVRYFVMTVVQRESARARRRPRGL